nr:hypothetical protein [Leptolyngbya sp. FACHB-541]
MRLADSVALITGANGGLGKAYVEALLAAGALCDNMNETPDRSQITV